MKALSDDARLEVYEVLKQIPYKGFCNELGQAYMQALIERYKPDKRCASVSSRGKVVGYWAGKESL